MKKRPSDNKAQLEMGAKYGYWHNSILLVGLVWAYFVCYKFYAHSPFSFAAILDVLFSYQSPLLPKFSALTHYATGVFWAFSLMGSSYFLGRFIIHWLFQNFLLDLERILFSLSLGYVFWGYLSFFLGVSGFLYRHVFIGLIFSMLILGGIFFRKDINFVVPCFIAIKKNLFSGWQRILITLLILLVFTTAFVMAFVPEIFYDALVYHLGVPNFYLQEHKLVAVDVLPSKFPFLIQMIYLVGLALQDEIVTKLTHWIFFLLLASAFYALGERLKKIFWALISILVFSSIPTVQMNVWTSGIDIGVCLLGFLAVYCFLCSWEDTDNFNKWLILSSVFSGAAVSAKYTVVYIPVVLFALNSWFLVTRKMGIKNTIRSLGLYSFVVILFLIPWLCKNWMQTGNPFYPFLSEFFGQVKMASWRYQILRGENYGVTPTNVLEFLKLPWTLSIKERTSLSFHGPLFLAFAPLFFTAFLTKKDSLVKNLFYFTLLFLPMGFLMTRLTRYLLPGLTVVSCAISYGLFIILLDKGILKRLVFFGTFLVACFQQITWAFILIKNSYAPGMVLSGTVSRDAYQSHYHSGMNPNPSNVMYRYIEKNLPRSKVLIVGDEKAYRLNVRHLYSGVYDDSPLLQWAIVSEDEQKLFDEFNKNEVSHVLVNLFEGKRLLGYGIFDWPEEKMVLFCKFWDRHVRFVHQEDIPEKSNPKPPVFLFEVISEEKAKNLPIPWNPVFWLYEEFKIPGESSDAMARKKAWISTLYEKSLGVVSIQRRYKELYQIEKIN